jgi:hypothetical protein
MSDDDLWRIWEDWQDAGDPQNPPVEVWDLYNREKQRVRNEAITLAEAEAQTVRLIERLGI